jgi:hypothetical protein
VDYPSGETSYFYEEIGIVFFTKDGKDWPSDTKVLTDQYSPANLLNF